MAEPFDFDWVVIGSGFGGSVSALRLAEKGYSVCVLECGRRFEDDDFAKSAWNLRRYLWSPRLGMRGVLRLTLFKDVFIGSGCGVGGGSLGYANTLYRARPAFFRDPQWAELADWERELRPHYEVAERMLGVVDYEGIGPADALLREYGEEIGVGNTFANTRVGVFFDHPSKEVPDPFFGGEGPARAGCRRCGSCMVGCRYNAKNTLVKNYLWFAEGLGARIVPASTAAPGGGAGAEPSPPGELSSPPGRWAPTSCSPTAATAAPCPAFRTESGMSFEPTRSPCRQSPRGTTTATSPTRWRSPRASIRSPLPTSRW